MSLRQFTVESYTVSHYIVNKYPISREITDYPKACIDIWKQYDTIQSKEWYPINKTGQWYVQDDSWREWITLETDLYQIAGFEKRLKYSVPDRMPIVWLVI